ncbi:hypothetical protein INT45_013921 [Circinella minor]|uniref:Uncharacterized protein n=1 Tax=Circinella minor TaxID=1195481 RepID=A0A8H7RXZ3_9FUNG|nr:hypothetical protein INT45_013921 [Circinella minor]
MSAVAVDVPFELSADISITGILEYVRKNDSKQSTIKLLQNMNDGESGDESDDPYAKVMNELDDSFEEIDTIPP